MHKLLSTIIIFGLLAYAGTAIAGKDNGIYWIDKNTTVLAFIGDPHSLNLKTTKYTIAKKQRILLFHKRSGPGIYAFYLRGIVVKNPEKRRTLVREQGYFLVKKSQIRKTFYKHKTSMKKESMK